MKIAVSLAVAVPLLAGCASTQLNYNTLEISGTVDNLLASQISHNLAKFLQDENSIPSQVSISGGSVTTTNQVGASWTDPLTKAVTATGAPLKTSQTLFAGESLQPSASNQWSQNWSVAPITDSDQVRRLAALYRYVTAPYSVDLCRDYPLITTQGSANSSTPSNSSEDDEAWSVVNKSPTASAYNDYLALYSNHRWAARKLNEHLTDNPTLPSPGTEEGDWFNALKSDNVQGYSTFIRDHPGSDYEKAAAQRARELLKKEAQQGVLKKQAQQGAGQSSDRMVFGNSTVQTSDGQITQTAADAQFLHEPSCIICSKKANEKNLSRSPAQSVRRRLCSGQKGEDLYVNPRLRNDWLVYAIPNGTYFQVTQAGPEPDSGQGVQSIGGSGTIFLYTRDSRAYHEFILFVLEATSQGSTSGVSGKIGGGTAGRAGGAQFAPAGAAVLLQ